MKAIRITPVPSALLSFGLTLLAQAALAATDPAVQITVDYAVDKGASTQLASGFLHGISSAAPAQYLIDGVKVTSIRGADHHANEPELFDPTNHARVAQTGAKIMVGLYYYSSDPANTYWPGDNGDYATWRGIVKSVYDEAKTKGYEVYSWITWNEPTLQWRTTARPIAHYFQAHLNAYQVIKALNPAARIQAPENNSYNASFIKQFLTFCKANNCLPDVLSWHELTSGAVPDIEGHTADIKAWMTANGIKPMPIAVTEYGGGSYGNASTYSSGKMLHYIARLERSAANGLIFGLKSEWDYIGSDAHFIATLGDTADKGSATLPAGMWWLYHGYKETTGRLLQTASTNDAFVTSLAATDSQMKRSVILIGNQDTATAATVTLALKNLNQSPFLLNSGQVHLCAELISPANIVYVPPVALEGDYSVSGNDVTVKLPTLGTEYAYKVTLSAATHAATRTVYEAESLTPTFTAGRTYYTFQQTGASGGTAGNLQSSAMGDFIKYTINLPAAGVYNLRGGLKSEHNRAILQLYVNGVAVGGPKDEFGPNAFYSSDFGNLSLPSGNTTLEFRAVGKNMASTGYVMVFDDFIFLKLN